MGWFMVWGSKKRPKGFMGGSYLDWSEGPVGAYMADDAAAACQQAAKDSAIFGTFFAVEGYAWGVELMETGARQLGRREPLEDRLHAALDKLDTTDRQIGEAARQYQLPQGDD